MTLARPLLTFDAPFEDETKPELALMKEMFIQTFGAPRNHPKSTQKSRTSDIVRNLKLHLSSKAIRINEFQRTFLSIS